MIIFQLPCISDNQFVGNGDIYHGSKTVKFQPSLSWDENNIYVNLSWCCHQMETFSVSLAICAGNSPVIGEFPAQRPVARSFDVFFDLRLNGWLSKQSWGRWFETPLRPLWCQSYGMAETQNESQNDATIKRESLPIITPKISHWMQHFVFHSLGWFAGWYFEIYANKPILW